MAVIRIREQKDGANSTKAKVIFEGGAEYDIIIHNPFSEEEERQVEWYFEDHLRFPFTRQVEASNVVKRITKYGEILFQQIFGNPDIYALYRDCLRDGLHKTSVEIVGSPDFHRLHWEALKDPKFDLPLATQATILRKNIIPQPLPAIMRSSPTINVLIITARPFGKGDVGYRTISRPLVEELHQANLPVRIEILRPGTYKALDNHLRDMTNEHGVGYYHIVHFDVHGAILTYEQVQQVQEEQNKRANRYQYASPYGRPSIALYEGGSAFLFLEDEQDNIADPVEATSLANLLQRHQIPIAILNACQSGKQVGDRESSLGNMLVQAGMQLVLAMSYSITVSAAQLMMRTLYSKLFANNDLPTAIRYARQELYNSKERRAYFNQYIELEDWLLPVLYQNQVLHLTTRAFTPEEHRAYYLRESERYPAPKTTYKFVGRDLDILQIEKALLTRRNILLIRGMGGAGKTTLLHHLGYWWQTTGFIDQVFYFGYDKRAWTLQQIFVAIAQKLLPDPVDYASQFQSLPTFAAQQALIAQLLCTKRHLLILDNLEAITDTFLATQHTLPQEEQEAFSHFLADLVGSRTLVLLGSRGEEAWLAKGTFDDTIHELGGLDPEAASTLTDLILQHHNIGHYRKDLNLLKLVNLLGGFPIALEVVLVNLVRQTPKEVMEALQSGSIDLNTGGNQERTENILYCIDYSHSNLSSEAQDILMCLAPFTSVLCLNLMEQYAALLQQQPALRSLSWGRLPQVIQEVKNLGLLEPDSEVPNFLRLHPTLPYFLRRRLGAIEQREMHSAVETAFRLLYDQISTAIGDLLNSHDPQQRLQGQVLAQLEYENLTTALKQALQAQDSILNPYVTLMAYLTVVQDQRRGLELGQTVLDCLKDFQDEKLKGSLGAEYAGVIDSIAKWQLLLKQYTAAEASYFEALRLFSQVEHIEEDIRSKWKAKIYHNLGFIAREQRQWSKAERYYQQVLQIYEGLHDRQSQAPIYGEFGTIAKDQRQWSLAKDLYQQALQIFIEFDDRSNMAPIYHNLGNIAEEHERWDDADRYYQQALQIWSKFNDRGNQAKVYLHLGTTCQRQALRDKAEHYYQQALLLSIELNDQHLQATLYSQLGLLAQQQDQPEQAEHYYEKGLHLNNSYRQAQTYYNWGILSKQRGKLVQSRDYLLHALAIFVDDKDDYSSNFVLRHLAQLWQVSEDPHLPSTIAPMISSSPDEVEALLRKMLANEADVPRSM